MSKSMKMPENIKFKLSNLSNNQLITYKSEEGELVFKPDTGNSGSPIDNEQIWTFKEKKEGENTFYIISDLSTSDKTICLNANEKNNSIISTTQESILHRYRLWTFEKVGENFRIKNQGRSTEFRTNDEYITVDTNGKIICDELKSEHETSSTQLWNTDRAYKFSENYYYVIPTLYTETDKDEVLSFALENIKNSKTVDANNLQYLNKEIYIPETFKWNFVHAKTEEGRDYYLIENKLSKQYLTVPIDEGSHVYTADYDAKYNQLWFFEIEKIEKNKKSYFISINKYNQDTDSYQEYCLARNKIKTPKLVVEKKENVPYQKWMVNKVKGEKKPTINILSFDNNSMKMPEGIKFKLNNLLKTQDISIASDDLKTVFTSNKVNDGTTLDNKQKWIYEKVCINGGIYYKIISSLLTDDNKSVYLTAAQDEGVSIYTTDIIISNFQLWAFEKVGKNFRIRNLGKALKKQDNNEYITVATDANTIHCDKFLINNSQIWSNNVSDIELNFRDTNMLYKIKYEGSKEAIASQTIILKNNSSCDAETTAQIVLIDSSSSTYSFEQSLNLGIEYSRQIGVPTAAQSTWKFHLDIGLTSSQTFSSSNSIERNHDIKLKVGSGKKVQVVAILNGKKNEVKKFTLTARVSGEQRSSTSVPSKLTTKQLLDILGNEASETSVEGTVDLERHGIVTSEYGSNYDITICDFPCTEKEINETINESNLPQPPATG